MKKNVLIYGDSNTWGYCPGVGSRFPSDVRWPGVVARLLGEDFEVREEGMGGRTTVYDHPRCDLLNGRKGLGYAMCSTRFIDMVVISLGTNDLLFTNAANSAIGIDEIIRLVQNADACFPAGNGRILRGTPKVLVISPIHLHPDIYKLGEDSAVSTKYEESLKFARLYKKMAENRGVEFLDAALYAEPSSADYVHMDAASHRRLGEAVAEKIRQMYAE